MKHSYDKKFHVIRLISLTLLKAEIIFGCQFVSPVGQSHTLPRHAAGCCLLEPESVENKPADSTDSLRDSNSLATLSLMGEIMFLQCNDKFL